MRKIIIEQKDETSPLYNVYLEGRFTVNDIVNFMLCTMYDKAKDSSVGMSDLDVYKIIYEITKKKYLKELEKEKRKDMRA